MNTFKYIYPSTIRIALIWAKTRGIGLEETDFISGELRFINPGDNLRYADELGNLIRNLERTEFNLRHSYYDMTDPDQVEATIKSVTAEFYRLYPEFVGEFD